MSEQPVSESEFDTEVEDVTSEAVEPDGTNDEVESSDEELLYEVDGEEVTLGQLRKWKSGGLREADYTEKTEALAKDRKELDSQFDSVKAEKGKLNDRVEFLTQLENEARDLMLGAAVDETLLEDDPQEYMRQKARYDERVSKVQEIGQKIAETRQEMNDENAVKLHDALGWSDEEKKSADLKVIEGYVKEIGLTSERFGRVEDPEVMTAFLEAGKYRALKAKNKQVRKVPKTPTPEGESKPEVKSLAERMYAKD